MPEIAVETEHLGRVYHDLAALSGVTLQIPSGVHFGLLGPNGGGKTTLLRIVATMLRPTEGTARVFGMDVTRESDPVRRRLGFVFQQPALDDELTVSENLRVHGALYGMSRRQVSTRLDYLLPLFGLEDRAGARTKTLSGGLKRRADLVRGLLHSPSLLLLDEPTSGLDPAARQAFWAVVHRLRDDEGITVLLATHLLDEAEQCDTIAIVDRGHVVTQGTPERLRAELGPETVWLQGPHPRQLADRIEAHLNVPVRIVGESLQVSHPEGHDLLPELYRRFGEDIHSATIRRPTLHDVFMLHAGHRLDDPSLEENRVASS